MSIAARAIAIYAKTHGEAEAYAKLTDWDRAVLQAIEEALAAATLNVNPATPRHRSEFHTFRPMRIGEAAREYQPSPTAYDAPPITLSVAEHRTESSSSGTIGPTRAREHEE